MGVGFTNLSHWYWLILLYVLVETHLALICKFLVLIEHEMDWLKHRIGIIQRPTL